MKFCLQNIIEGMWLREGRRDGQSMNHVLGDKKRVKGAIYSQLNWAILLC